MFCSPTGVTGRKHANTRMQTLPAKINAFAETFQKLGGLPIYIRAVTDEVSRPQNMKWLDKVKGVSFPANPNHRDYDFYGLTIPEDAVTPRETLWRRLHQHKLKADSGRSQH